MSSAQLEALERKEELERDPLRQKLGSPLQAGARILNFALGSKDKAVLALSSHQAKTANLDSLQLAKGAAKHTGPVTAVALLNRDYNGSQIALSASWDKSIRMWPVDNPQHTLAVFSGHADFVKCLAVHPTLPLVYSGSADKSIMYWKLPESSELMANCDTPPTINPVKTIKGQHTGQIYALCIDPVSADVLYSTGSDASIRAWNAQTGAAIHSDDMEQWFIPRGEHKTNVFDCKVTENTLWTASADKTAIGWDVETRAADLVLEHDASVNAVLPIPQAGIVATGVHGGVIYIWKVNSGSPEIIREIHAHTDDVTCLRAAGRKFYSSALDGTLRTWDIKDIVDFTGGMEYIPAELEALKQSSAKPKDNLAKASNSALTEEEERELAELMSDLDDM
ncbi:hypothetical protein LPJ78_003479 [Coemansia sp. RSA 989]|nr:hypothetical protein LPJ78_003479 [Coemansia sp. RSA 989]KAJ1871811.1 hypothetical protein LPJ55_003571 [Coemansia sp. RSA 990]KAJ2631874.1 hypothetical protein H4R22_001677 [Coemansia sp. RSA 1290]KAJ2653350.1 hypothetical protein IWW40_000403 [Coemansia sp. RSA 1250]KAJ2676279.1 hypothetical protein IWW42_000567 [Coemansia sp. RSA 1085]